MRKWYCACLLLLACVVTGCERPQVPHEFVVANDDNKATLCGTMIADDNNDAIACITVWKHDHVVGIMCGATVAAVETSQACE